VYTSCSRIAPSNPPGTSAFRAGRTDDMKLEFKKRNRALLQRFLTKSQPFSYLETVYFVSPTWFCSNRTISWTTHSRAGKMSRKVSLHVSRYACSLPRYRRSSLTSNIVLDPLEPHTSPGGALITLGTSGTSRSSHATPFSSRTNATTTSPGTHYDLLACQLESFSRPLWGLVSLISGGSTYSRTSTWSRGLAAGTDPEGDEYWGGSKGKDQRMVEMSAIGFALAMAPKEFLEVSFPILGSLDGE
jgi:hypothetical protein